MVRVAHDTFHLITESWSLSADLLAGTDDLALGALSDFSM